MAFIAGFATAGVGDEDGFVFVRNIAGDCTGVGTLELGVNPFGVGANTDGADSGSGSDLKTLSKRARLKYDNP